MPKPAETGAPPRWAAHPRRKRDSTASSGGRDGFISRRVLTGYQKVVELCGERPELLLQEFDISAHSRAEHIPFGDYIAVLERTATNLNMPDFGMRLGIQQDGVSLMPPLEMALKSSTTVRDFFHCGSSYMHVYSSGIRTRLERLPGTGLTALILDVIEDGVPFRRQAVEQLLMKASRSAIVLSDGNMRATEVWFGHAPLLPELAYGKRFGCNVRFEAMWNALLFQDSDLAMAPASGDRIKFHRELERISSVYPDDSSVSSMIRRVLVSRLELGDCSRETIAENIGMSSRTLHRRLKDEGATFEKIIDQVRRNLTLHFLAQSSLSLSEIAIRVGYAEQSVLSHSCQRWFGTTPGNIRNTLSSGSWQADVSLELSPDRSLFTATH